MNQSQQNGTKQNLVQPKKLGRRMVLLIASYGAFLVAAVAALIPFVKSFNPSRRAVAVGGPVEVAIGDMQPGELRLVKWRGKPVWIVRRTDEMLASLSLVKDLLADPESQASDQPEYAQNPYRSRKQEWLVMVGICTHLGCSPLYRPEKGAADIGADWQGGFFCPCHGSRFDISGRVYKNLPAPTNMTVPEYVFVDDNTLRIGVSEGEVA